jgi:RNA polymerase sigma factor (sigma-70 family)
MSYQLLADDLLVRLLSTSDEKAFRVIYERYWEKIYFSVLKKINSREAAEELTQNLFVSLWEKREKATIKHLENYLSVAIKYIVINYIESCIARQNALVGIAGGDLADNTAEEKLLFDEVDAAIKRATSLLPPKTREIFKLSRLDRHSVREIAQIMNLSEKAVEYHITQSLKMMRLQLKEFMVFEVVFLLLLMN